MLGSSWLKSNVPAKQKHMQSESFISYHGPELWRFEGTGGWCARMLRPSSGELIPPLMCMCIHSSHMKLWSLPKVNRMPSKEQWSKYPVQALVSGVRVLWCLFGVCGTMFVFDVGGFSIQLQIVIKNWAFMGTCQIILVLMQKMDGSTCLIQNHRKSIPESPPWQLDTCPKVHMLVSKISGTEVIKTLTPTPPAKNVKKRISFLNHKIQ